MVRLVPPVQVCLYGRPKDTWRHRQTQADPQKPIARFGGVPRIHLRMMWRQIAEPKRLRKN